MTSIKTSALCRPIKAFSLFELIVVMAIISLLLAVSIPAFSDKSNNARRTSCEVIKAHIQQARAHAIAKKTPTALIIPISSSGKNLGSRAISLIEVALENGSYVPRQNEQGDAILLQRWAILTGSFYFLPASLIGSETPTVIDSEETFQMTYRGRDLICHRIIFAANGQIIRPTSGVPIHLAIAQAKKTNDTFRITQQTGGKPVFELLQINRLTGSIHVIGSR